MPFKLRTLSMIMATAFALPALAGTNWVDTQTKAPSVRSTNSGASVMAAEVASPSQVMHVTVSLKLQNKDALDARVAAIKSGSTTSYLTPEQFKSLHSPSDAQAQAVAAYLTSAGFRNVTIAPNNLLVSGDGTAALAATAFNTEIHNFNVDGAQVYANVKSAQVPSQLDGIVVSVHGLDNAVVPHTMLVHASTQATPVSNSTGSVQSHQPTDFPALYDAASLPPAANATVGIISWGILTQVQSDLAKFEANAGITPVPVSVVNVGGQPTSANAIDEWDLDSQDIVAAAGGKLKGLVFYAANSSLQEAYNKVVTDHVANVINVSLGGCELDYKQTGEEAADDQIFEAAVAQNQTFSVSSGDSGSAECGKTAVGQSYPAVSPYVMSIGGTTLYTTNKTTYGSEIAWSAGGGGPSATEPAPSWQTGANVLGTSKFRGVPDIALDADPASGALVIVNGVSNQIGGTSLSAPLFAGFWARIQSMNNNGLAFPDPAIYAAAAKNGAAFRDITSGSNGSYSAKAGWDYTTGWGSPDVTKVAAVVTGSTVTPPPVNPPPVNPPPVNPPPVNPPPTGSFSGTAVYHTGSAVTENGKSYVMTVEYKGAVVSNYWVYGNQCDPATCTSRAPYMTSYSAGVPWLISYWTQQ
jgi:pseudomonalisin